MSNRRLTVSAPIVIEDGTMEREFLDWTLEVIKWVPLLGQGSPETVVTAPQYSLYIDTNGIAGAIEYRKMLAEIGGDTSKGWLLV
jgi:hypothetical protein